MTRLIAMLAMLFITTNTLARGNDYGYVGNPNGIKKALQACSNKYSMSYMFGIAGAIAHDISVKRCMKSHGYVPKKHPKVENNDDWSNGFNH